MPELPETSQVCSTLIEWYQNGEAADANALRAEGAGMGFSCGDAPCQAARTDKPSGHEMGLG